MDKIKRPVKVQRSENKILDEKYYQVEANKQFETIYDYLDNMSAIDRIYPVGSIYMSINNTNPSELFGGEWEAIEDVFLLGASETYTGTGGSMTKTFTHNHTLKTNINTHSGQGSGIAYTSGSYIFHNNDTQAIQNKEITLDITPSYLAVYIWKRVS